VKLSKLKTVFHSQLKSIYPKTEIAAFFSVLTSYKLGLTRVDIALQPDFILTEIQNLFFQDCIEKLKKEIPIQYITGRTEFYSLPFFVNKNVLIPRPETEDLISTILKNTQHKGHQSILDIGTGSGCIAISLAKNLPNAKIQALDFSKTAIETAKKNALLNDVNITFKQQDIIKTTQFSEKFDIIVSNPPYVRNLEKKEIRKNVLKYEPHSALFVDDEMPLMFYSKIADLALKHLNPDGHLYFEINQYLGKEMIEMLSEKGFSNNLLKKDIFGNDRITVSSI